MEIITNDETEQTHAELEAAIIKHYRAMWAANGETELVEHGQIPSWALVIHFHDLRLSPASGDYSVETSADLPSHGIKGLFGEGHDWVTEMQELD